jgi:hypothetical protein
VKNYAGRERQLKVMQRVTSIYAAGASLLLNETANDKGFE